MIDLILPEARLGFAQPLMQMHHDRKRVFVDHLGWTLPTRGSWLEVDEFDNDYAVYLLARSARDGSHQGSLRLLPSTRPHMLSELFGELCSGPPPAHQGCWEISRLVTNPSGATGTSVLRVHRLLALALLEFAGCNGISSYTLVIEASRVPALLSIGWSVAPLGLPASVGGELVQALEIRVRPGSLEAARSRFRIPGPVLRTPATERIAA
jgi:acyl-homoserine lactone synthase